MYKLYKINYKESSVKINVDDLEKILLAELDKMVADKIHEKSIKHVHIHINVIWMCVTDEKKYGVKPMTYCYLEGYER